MKIGSIDIPDKIIDGLYMSLIEVCKFKEGDDTKKYAIELIVTHIDFINSIGGRIVWDEIN